MKLIMTFYLALIIGFFLGSKDAEVDFCESILKGNYKHGECWIKE